MRPGGLAQMAERVLSMHEVAGSMPASSTQTATLRGEYRVPSDPRSQAPSGPVSTIVGDQIGSPGAVCTLSAAELAQSVERKALNLVVVGSSPTFGGFQICTCFAHFDRECVAQWQRVGFQTLRLRVRFPSCSRHPL